MLSPLANFANSYILPELTPRIYTYMVPATQPEITNEYKSSEYYDILSWTSHRHVIISSLYTILINIVFYVYVQIVFQMPANSLTGLLFNWEHNFIHFFWSL